MMTWHLLVCQIYKKRIVVLASPDLSVLKVEDSDTWRH